MRLKGYQIEPQRVSPCTHNKIDYKIDKEKRRDKITNTAISLSRSLKEKTKEKKNRS